LLQFRLQSYSNLKVESVPGEEELQPRSRDLLRCLAAPFRGDSNIIQVLQSVLKKQESLREMISPRQQAVVRTVFDASHEHTRNLQDFV